jgi:exosome complex component CSL4
MATIVLPGQVIGSAATHQAGPGAHVFDSKIYASIVGTKITTPASDKKSKPIISVPRFSSALPSTPFSRNNSLPIVGSVVLCRVTRVQKLQASASILFVDTSPPTASYLSYTASTNEELQFAAILRREDTRAYEKDKVVMNEMLRVGDIVRASVISLGDERSYYISTAGNDFGVAVAVSEDGNAMVPVSWKEMRDVFNGKPESRKVAKPV